MPISAPTLSGPEYTDPEIFRLEQQRIFHAGWFLACRADTLAKGNRKVIDVAGESILVARDLDDTIHAYANVCRHRGARLCDRDSDSTQGSLMCPYHAWTYALDGRLISTPHLDDTQVDKAALSLWKVAVQVWEGFVFVCLADQPPAWEDWFSVHGAEVAPLARYGLSVALAIYIGLMGIHLFTGLAAFGYVSADQIKEFTEIPGQLFAMFI